jgi:hypothetical protein
MGRSGVRRKLLSLQGSKLAGVNGRSKDAKKKSF